MIPLLIVSISKFNSTGIEPFYVKPHAFDHPMQKFKLKNARSTFSPSLPSLESSLPSPRSVSLIVGFFYANKYPPTHAMYRAIKWHSQDFIAKHSQGDKFSCLELCDCPIKGENFIYVRVQMQLYGFGVLWKPLWGRIAVTGLTAYAYSPHQREWGWGPQTFEVAWKDDSAGLPQLACARVSGNTAGLKLRRAISNKVLKSGTYQSLLSGSVSQKACGQAQIPQNSPKRGVKDWRWGNQQCYILLLVSEFIHKSIYSISYY